MPGKRSVLIIRPLVAAHRTAALVAARGFAPFVMPLSAVMPLAPVFADKHYDGVIATSAAAFLQPLPANAAQFRDLPFYCVGSRTAEAARQNGFTVIAAIADHAAVLADILERYKDKRFLYLAGQLRRPVLENRLRQAGVQVDSVEVYTTKMLPPTPAQIAALPHPVDYVLLYSAESVRFLPALAEVARGRTQALCLSARIAAAVPPGFTGKVQVAARPTEQALLGLLA